MVGGLGSHSLLQVDLQVGNYLHIGRDHLQGLLLKLVYNTAQLCFLVSVMSIGF